MIFPTVISLTCGQNITIETLVGVASLVIQCILSFTLTTAEVYKDGELVSNNFSLTITPASNADFGTYTFVASTEGCGSTSAVSRVSFIRFIFQKWYTTTPHICISMALN